MNVRIKKILAGILCGMMLLTAGGCGKDTQKETAAALNEAYADSTVIAVVEGVNIMRGALTQRIDMLAASMAQQYQMEITKESMPDFFESMKDIAFEDLCLGILLDKEAEKENYELSKEELQAYQDDLEQYAQSLGQTSEEYIHSLCATQDDMMQEYARNMFIAEKRSQFTESAEVTEEEAKEYYDAHISQFTTPAGIQISHILVTDEEKAKELIAQLENGADFAELATANSTDTASAQKGGDLGVVNENTNFVQEFKTAALALEPGEFTKEPVQSTYGFHIIQAGERTEESVQPFDTAKTLISYQLKSVKGQEAIEKYVEDMQAAANIEDLREEQDRSATPETEDETAATEGTEAEATESAATEAAPEQK